MPDSDALFFNGSSNGTNATLPPDSFQASLGLCLGLSIPVGICLIPCCLATLPMITEIIGTSDSSSNLGMALAAPYFLLVWCCSTVFALAAFVVGMVSILPTDTNDVNGIILTILGAVTLCTPCICWVFHVVTNGCCCDSDGSVDCWQAFTGHGGFCDVFTACLCTPCTSRQMEQERERRRQEEANNDESRYPFSNTNPFRGGGPTSRDGQPNWSLRRGLSFLAPNEFLCPVTLMLMDDPVTVVASGIDYERRAITEWLRLHPRRDPKTNVEFEHDLSFEANLSLREQIKAWVSDPVQQAALVALESETEEKASQAASS